MTVSIPSEDPYEEAAQQLLEQAPRSPEYIPDPMELEDHVPVYITEPKHPEDLSRALEVVTRDVASPLSILYTHQGPPPLLLNHYPSTISYLTDIPRLTRRVGRDYYYSLPDLCVDWRRGFCCCAANIERRIDDRLRDGQQEGGIHAAVRAEIEVLRRERLAYKQESMETHQALASVKHTKAKNYTRGYRVTTEPKDEKTHAYTERQAERKRKYDDLSKNNQNQQQLNKRQNTCQAYTPQATNLVFRSIIGIGFGWRVTMEIDTIKHHFRCTKTRSTWKKIPIFLAHVTAKEIEDKSEKKRLEDVPIVQDFREVFPEDLPSLPPTRNEFSN
ncbi:hypothetical protein Tco_1506994 [Tanacetum coccineum]